MIGFLVGAALLAALVTLSLRTLEDTRPVTAADVQDTLPEHGASRDPLGAVTAPEGEDGAAPAVPGDLPTALWARVQGALAEARAWSAALDADASSSPQRRHAAREATARYIPDSVEAWRLASRAGGSREIDDELVRQLELILTVLRGQPHDRAALGAPLETQRRFLESLAATSGRMEP